MPEILGNHIFSLETLDSHKLVHNDITPQNYLVNFLNGQNDLTQIDIVLTDFGLVGQNSKGGTPIFASPECFDVKTNASDIFSLSDKFLFVPITSSTDKNYLMNTILNQSDIFGLIRLMMKTQRSSRIQLSQVRIKFNDLKRNSQIKMNSFAQAEIDRITTQNLSPEILNYIQDLDHIS